MSETEENDKVWYCPRCDRPYSSKEALKEHIVKHPDYNPALHGDLFEDE